MKYTQDHINAIEVLEDYEIEFKCVYACSNSIRFEINVSKSKESPFFKDYQHEHVSIYNHQTTHYAYYDGHPQTTERVIYNLNNFNPMMVRIFKLSGFKLESYKILNKRECSNHEICLIFTKRS